MEEEGLGVDSEFGKTVSCLVEIDAQAIPNNPIRRLFPTI